MEDWQTQLIYGVDWCVNSMPPNFDLSNVKTCVETKPSYTPHERNIIINVFRLGDQIHHVKTLTGLEWAHVWEHSLGYYYIYSVIPMSLTKEIDLFSIYYNDHPFTQSVVDIIKLDRL